MISKTTTRLSTGRIVNSEFAKHRKFTTKQKAKINKLLERINEYVFEVYDNPTKVYTLNDIYRVIGIIINDGIAKTTDEAIIILQERIS